MKWARGTPSFAIIIPAAVMLVWICYLSVVSDQVPVMLLAVSQRRLLWTGGLAAAVVNCTAVALRAIGDRPDLKDKDVVDPLLPPSVTSESRESTAVAGPSAVPPNTGCTRRPNEP
jgi:hypothetical protein